ncbi:MAG: SCP2 sterol-binding domain-containing protein [Rhodocyclaceae bacterium]|nr:SCP2 sterol-binding domain-containing protein [Rhodocyclaceae bacterium]MCP5297772.1 SCP2 sterol-binding domain-containing protein [Zoogloeaceae bacterium]PKO66960.1 MAG: sterol-binding protein [Betaproteobacteria bacterium HGW-Betaproteobacteria-14]MBX3676162.1 SCP2 sterol-binding domain-containing protein [Rhodocyclaceae bacterium]MCB1892666.1 SCP2 sterol-binding domain-containing protein [Rhodocyclaceae bacterium]
MDLIESLRRARIPQFVLPRFVGGINARLPQLPPTLGLTTALNLALDRILPRDTLEPLTGKLVCLRVTDGGLTLLFTLTPKGFRPAVSNSKPDLLISAKARDFLALALREEDPDTLFFNRRLVMEGDTDLGLLVKNTLDAVDWPRLEPDALHPFRLLAALRLRLGPGGF